MKVPFVKMHGAGNDYIYFDCLHFPPPADMAALAIRLSDRHKGIGGDGAVFICPSEAADARMRMFNADGSEGKMCGNAIRCVAKYLYDSGAVPRAEMRIETGSGVKQLACRIEGGKVRTVRVDMGPACFDPKSLPVSLQGEVVGRKVHIAGGEHAITCVSMGNPHCVVFEDPDGLDLAAVGPRFECDPLFPERVNTEFVRQTGARSLRMRVWERGSGETLACGTGACAAAAAAVKLGLCPRGEDISVQLLGGELIVNVGDTVTMTGEAVLVFKGEIEL